MAGIAEIFESAALTVFTHLGVPATFTPVSGAPGAIIQVLLSEEMQTQPSGMSSETWGQRTTVEMRLSDLLDNGPVPGDTVTIGAVSYTLAAPLENNGQLVKWVVT